MDVLLLDTASRGDAEAWAASKSELFDPKKDRVFLYPERALSQTENLEGVPSFEELGKDWKKALPHLVRFAGELDDVLVIVSADSAIAADSFGHFNDAGMNIAAPTVEAAKIETSKKFMKELAIKLGVPTAKYKSFTEHGEIVDFAMTCDKWPAVIKADVPAEGKGVRVCNNLAELVDGLNYFKSSGWMGEGQEIVVEEYLEGPEISLHAWCDGENYVMFPFAMQDHKTRYEDDEGPMTGGMGVVAPVPGLTEQDMEKLGEIFIKPFVDELNKVGRPFKGVMYPSIKLTIDGPKLLEVNARPGDPEAPAFLRLLKSDFLKITLACAQGRLKEIPKPKWRKGAAVCIPLAAKGYPLETEAGAAITGIKKAKKVKSVRIFDYGTKRNEKNELVVNSGRVLAVTARGKNLKQALKRGYKATEAIRFDGEEPGIRKDLGDIACGQLIKGRVKIMRQTIAT